MKNYILPSLFGACFASMALKKIPIAVYALPIALAVRYYGVSAWLSIVTCIFGVLALTYVLYKGKVVR